MKWVHFPLFERTFIFFHLEVKFSYRVTVTVCSGVTGALNSVTRSHSHQQDPVFCVALREYG